MSYQADEPSGSPKRPNVEVFSPRTAFSITERMIGTRRTLLLPQYWRSAFRRAHVVRSYSLRLAARIPDQESEASGRYSFTVHKDNFGDDNDPKRFLMLSKPADGARGASTFVCLPEVAFAMLAMEERYFQEHREMFRTEGADAYNPKFQISALQYARCLEEDGGYESVIGELMDTGRSAASREMTSLNVLNYLMRGPGVEPLMQRIREEFRDALYEEPWEKGGVIIIDNARVCHGRFGGNFPPLRRNFCI